MYLIDFYHGALKDSFATGELYEFNPETLDARNSGTLASLAGLEKAIMEMDRYQRELAIKRIELIHALFMFKRGVPMLYSGDEIAKLNDYSYKGNLEKSHDSRWLHRSEFNWNDVQLLGNHDDPKTIVFEGVKKLIEKRKQIYKHLTIKDEHAIKLSNFHVLGFHQIILEDSSSIILLFNCSEDRQWIYTSELKRQSKGGHWKEMMSGKTVSFDDDSILIGPYEIYLLQK